MTRNPAGPVVLEHSVFGAAGAERLVIVLREGPIATTDPDAPATIHHDVRVLAVRVSTTEPVDDSVFGGQTPAASAVDILDALIAGQVDLPPAPFGLVAVGDATGIAILLVDRLGEAIDRLALVAAPAPDSPLDRDLAASALGAVPIDTLVVVGSDDSAVTLGDAQFYVDALPRAAIAVVPGAAMGLGLDAAWPLVLEHVAG